MNKFDWLQIIAVLGTVTFLTPLLGRFMAWVFMKTKSSPIERVIYKIIGIKHNEEMNWKSYTKAILVFNFLGLIVVFLFQIFQGTLPLNPQKFPALSWHLALNTAISFITNTNWQSYSGEGTMSYLTQMAALAVQNFLSAATGLAVLLALIRGLSRKTTNNLGNFWVDMTRSLIYILIPISIIYSVILVGQGVPQNFKPAVEVTTLEGVKQTIPQGPAASQIAIKQIGTNGGGFFNANSAHPYENPTPFSNFLEMIALILLPAALTYTFGIMVGSKKHGVVLFAVMMTVLVATLGASLWAEYHPNAVFGLSGLMEGKETRFGITNSVLWSTLTTAASNGSVNAMHASLSPLAGGLAILNIMLGEIIFGGIGSGLYGMILFVILTVFLSGLMVGRTPEYLGKKIEARDIQMTILAVLAPSAVILLGSGISLVLPIALSSLSSHGPHGLSEMLYTFASSAGNNGSAFAGLNANTVYYNLILGFAMLVGRFAVIIPSMAIAGNMAKKKIAAPSFGTFTTDNALFAFLLIAVIVVVGALTFFPALALGPIVEHLLMNAGKTF